MLNRRRLMMGGAVLGALLVLFLAWSLFGGSDEPDFVTARVTRGDLERTVEATGTLMPKELISVGAQASGRIEKLNVEVGQQVSRGQLIAEIDPQTQTNALVTARASLDNVRAQLAASRAALTQAQLSFRRQKELGPGEATSQADYEAAEATLKTAEANYEALEAQLEQARANVSTAEVNLGYTRITAPIDGVVVSVVTEQGQTVNAAQSAPTIVILAQLDVMTVEAEISEADVIDVEAGMPAYFTILGDPDKRYSANLRLIEPAPASITSEVESSSSSASSSTSSSAIYYNALFDVANEDGRLRALMTAQVSIVLAQRSNVLQTPTSALGVRGKDGKYAVRVLTDGGKVEKRQVTIGLNNNVNAEVLSGLNLGDTIVISEAPSGAAKSSAGGRGGARAMRPPI